ncbi:MAG: CTP synthase [Candidatus Fermentibacteraceae bacterium]|nr:CTP synthase [Candidatus Fermentibacteraceae bacterium]MBN2607595.1 CTP synthase [Candidatus Fermentibacteraceae bacterium]
MSSGKCRYIFITGGVVSSLGKGITAASIALLLRQRGYRVTLQKLDPYLNIDPGTMSPYQHGEVYVTDDGTETDLDLGHYERFAGVSCNRNSNYTAGKIYSAVLARERKGGYLGKTVQVIPHVTDEIKKAILSQAAEGIDIAITEVGGTAGDIEGLPFLEALRELGLDLGRENVLYIHLTLIPYLSASRELKTKPSQQSASILRNIGIIPDILICRTERSLEEEHFRKLSLFCNVPLEAVVEEKNVENSIYEVPVELAEQKLDELILDRLGLPRRDLDLADWKDMLERAVKPSGPVVRIGVTGKYMGLRDAYKSIFEAITHGAIACDTSLEIRGIESEDLEEGDTTQLEGLDGILVPGGFGYRGIEGKLMAVRYARENDIPFLGICLGMQCAVIETARHIAGLEGANSSEFAPDSPHPVIHLMEDQKNVTEKGGTMRLGLYPCALEEDSLARSVFGAALVSERHRHRYEFNNDYRDRLREAGLVCSGVSPDGSLVEIVERPDHRWFVACQFHPEFTSTPLRPNPLFRAFIQAARDRKLEISSATE